MADGELTVQDVQAASSLEGVRDLLARLDYDVSEPVHQTGASLGIAERVQHQVIQARRVAARRIAPGLPPALEVYVLEVTSLTADLRKTVANAFRNVPANVLLILTTRDYDPLDFVLVKKSPRETRAPAGQVAVSHQLLSVDRRNPSRVHLRVLERMRNKAVDPYAQHQRITDAFKFAEWSEDEFNNRNLFSDYFLKHRLTIRELFPVWHTDVKPARTAIATVVQSAGAAAQLAAPDYAGRLIEPLLAGLGFDAKRAAAGDQVDYFLTLPGAADGQPCAGVLAYAWDRPLDRKDDKGRERHEDIPGIRVVKALEQHNLPWAILTNGRDWRLYCAKAHSRASNYYEIDLPHTLERDDLTAFRYFYLFFRAAAFAAPPPASGSDKSLCFLDQLLQGSAAFAKELGHRLRDHIFDEVFPYLAQGFVDYRRHKYDERTAAGDEFLGQAYDATLTLLYRLLFLLYAESLDLVPVNEPGYAGISLTGLKQEIAAAAGNNGDTVEQKLKDRFNRTDTALYQRLGKLFEVIDGQDNALSRKYNVPAYNGGLFRTGPDRDDRSREAAAARFLKKYRVPDFYLARAIDRLARDEDEKRHGELVPVDYKALGVRHLGSIYEGLLMYHVVIPRDDWEKGYQLPGLKVALVPSNKQRKSTGSYFTPQHIVKYIVTNTVGPLLGEKFAQIAPKLRQAQRDFEHRRAEKKPGTARTDDAIACSVMQDNEATVWNLLDLKVLDPAMGSGHFLVETVDFITDKVLDFLAGFPWNPVQVLIDQRIRQQILDSLDEQGVKINEDRLTDVNLIKRLVMKRCVYGVDLNPMAVELAKVSLWLDSFTLGAPLSFLDHHLKCGNSLIGTTIAELKKAVTESGSLFAIPMGPLDVATRLMERIANQTDASPAEAEKSAETYWDVLKQVRGYRALLDCLTARHFGQAKAGDVVVHAEALGLQLEDWERSLQAVAVDRQAAPLARIIRESQRISEERRFFHWDIDFPDVFFTARREPEHRGFDAVIGNPPYIFIIDVPDDCRQYYVRTWKSAEYRFDVYGIFIELALSVVPHGGRSGFIVPHTLLNNNSFGTLRAMLLKQCQELALIDFTVPIFEEASNEPMLILAAKSKPDAGECTRVCGARISDAELSPSALRLLPHGVFAALPGFPFVIPEDLDIGQVVQKCIEVGGRVGDYVEATQGLRTGDNERFLRSQPDGQGVWRPAIGGDQIGRYEIEPSDLYVDYDREALDAPRDEKFWTAAEKVIVQEIRNVHLLRRIIAALDSRQRIGLNTTNAVILRSGCKYDLGGVLAVLNSSITSEFMRACFRDNHVATQYIYSIPCPNLDRACGGIDLGAVRRSSASEAGAAAVLGQLGRDFNALCDRRFSILAGLRNDLESLAEIRELRGWDGYARLGDADYLGWERRYPSWRPENRIAADGRWFPNGVAPPLDGNGPGDIPWNLIARVYPSYPLPGIDTTAWEAAAWEEFCDLLRKNKSKIGNARIRADLTGRGAVENPTGAIRKLRETFLRYHREIRENRAKAAELDFLIDRIVFKLFDLTLDEQKLILSRVGPGRPLPPRRGKKHKPPASGDGTSTLFET